MSAPIARPRERSVLERLHPDNPVSNRPALARIRPPWSLRWVATGLALLFPVLALLLVVVPWQQSAVGVGRVIAFAPAERQQTIEAPVKGRITTWFVREGQRVEAGEPLVEISDNDPNLPARLQDQRMSLDSEVQATDDQIRSYESKLVAAEASRDRVVAEKRADLESMRQKRVGLAAEADTETRNLERTQVLVDEGIHSQRKLEVARAKANKAVAELSAWDRKVQAYGQALEKARADGDAKVHSVRAELDAARGKRTQVERKRLELETKQARQSAQRVLAPRAGVVLQLHGGLGGAQVKQGSVLATLVPDAVDRAVELKVDGNDMPFIQEGAEVRLVFEGWPALQVVGLDGARHGTFGGKVAFVDATDDGKGKFRAVVIPSGEEDWPDAERLRQGVRAKGFLLLGRVTLGYEIWRQINGFPPLPEIEKGEKSPITATKKPKAPGSLK